MAKQTKTNIAENRSWKTPKIFELDISETKFGGDDIVDSGGSLGEVLPDPS